MFNNLIFISIFHKDSTIPIQNKVALRIDDEKDFFGVVAFQFFKDYCNQNNLNVHAYKFKFYIKNQGTFYELKKVT